MSLNEFHLIFNRAFSVTAAGHVAEEETAFVEQPYSTFDLLSGWDCGQWPRDLYHPKLHGFPGPAV